MKALILISIFLTLVHQCVSVGNDRDFRRPKSDEGNDRGFRRSESDEEFCYGKKNCDPLAWQGANGICQNGNNQSPINIISPSGPASPGFVSVSNFAAPNFNMWNSGHAIVVEFNSTDYTFDGYGRLPGNYILNNGHFHWGKSSYLGSEHLIDGKSYSMELHLVHFDNKQNTNYDAAMASNDPRAVAVVAILFEVEFKVAPSEVLAPIVNQLKRQTEKFRTVSNDAVLVNEAIDWTSIIPTIHSHSGRVLNYQGSFTTPPCTEVVDWYVYEKINKMSESDVEAFRNIMGSIDKPLDQNHRPVQPLNNRVVEELKLQPK